MSACACMYSGCAKAGRCLASSGGVDHPRIDADLVKDFITPVVCPYCKTSALSWDRADLERGKRMRGNVLEYHCYAAKCMD